MRTICISTRKSSLSDFLVLKAYTLSYNWGGKVLGLNFDDHVGDW